MDEELTHNEDLELTDELREEFEICARINFWDPRACDLEKARAGWTPAKNHLYAAFYYGEHEPGRRRDLSLWWEGRRGVSMVTPAKFCEMIGGLDLLDHPELKSYQAKMGKKDTVDVIPFPLFKHGGKYLYFERDTMVELPQLYHRRYREWGLQDVLEDRESYEVSWCKFEPPIITPQHLRSPGDMEHSSTLHYALYIGKVRYSASYTADNLRELEPAPFQVFLHPVDKSFWIVFDTYPMHGFDRFPEEEEWTDTDEEEFNVGEGNRVTVRVYRHSIWDALESAPPVVAWRIPFSDMQRIAQRRTYVRGLVSTVIYDDNAPVPQVVVDGYDPTWNSSVGPRPLIYAPVKECWTKYREEILKPAAALAAARRGCNAATEFQQDPGPNDPSAD
ncbi:hypothetical protein FOPE_03406 [Fonsecaea pedrosoi]|nr:hypothetical protein FOPE_03406 [Fonsecaea pedrosoi]